MQAYVKPRFENRKPVLVRQPERAWAPLPKEGAWVQLDEYWSRRLRDGDVVEASPPEQTDEGDGVEKTAVAGDELHETTETPPAADKRRGR